MLDHTCEELLNFEVKWGWKSNLCVLFQNRDTREDSIISEMTLARVAQYRVLFFTVCPGNVFFIFIMLSTDRT